MYHAGLILEGGGMKGAYTSGVLDFFLDKGLTFDHCYGVSAGSINLCSYLSKQRRRGFRSLTEYMGNDHVVGLYSLLKEGNMINSEFAYEIVPKYLLPFDRETFEAYSGKAYAVAANIETGEAEYLPMRKMEEALEAIKASSALPLVFKTVEINGKKYLDGGLADSIPIKRSVLEGNKKHVVILTKEEGYIREPSKQLGLIKMRYFRYPKVAEIIKNRHTEYNNTMKYIKRLEEKGEVFLIQPKVKNDVSRLEKDEKKMEELYQTGYHDAAEKYEALLHFLERNE